MNSLGDYFHTDWAAMTPTDWFGTIVTVVIFLLLVGLFVYVFRPKNRERLEANKHIPLDDDETVISGDKNGG
ncbi:MAG: cbb3-type cytochrome c oxidase subunit 3 [Gammaproteobacteria bacterium]|nr:cbb3-type cytochrome c oxidase subunit 3 [Gammaproteobacteria bacterium]